MWCKFSHVTPCIRWGTLMAQCAKQVAAKRPYSNILALLPLKAKVLAFLEFLSLDRQETVRDQVHDLCIKSEDCEGAGW